MLSFSSIKPRSNPYASMMSSRLGQYKSPTMSYMSPRGSALQNAITRPKSDFMSVIPGAKKKDYASFSDQDWLDYQANKKKNNPVLTQATESQIQSPRSQQAGTNMSQENINNTNYSTPQATQEQSLFSSVLSQLIGRGNKGTKEYDKAQRAVRQRQKELEQIRENAAKTRSGIYQEAIPLEFEQGRDQVLTNQYLAQENAKATELAQAQAQVDTALSQQGQQNQALATALGQTSPRQSGYVLIDPTTGQPVGGTQSGLQAAQRGGQYSAAETGGQTYAQNNQVLTGVQNQLDSLAQLINGSNLNSLGINVGNATIQALEQNLSSSDYATLKNTLASINAALSQATGSPVNIEQLSSQQGTSLITTINNALQAARAQNQGYLNTSGGENNDPFGIGLI